MIRRPPRSTQGVSSAASDVYKRQVSTQTTWDYFTSKQHGFGTADMYYRCISIGQKIHDLKIPMLSINALDDPLVPVETLPYDDALVNKNYILATHPCGGHVGFFTGVIPHSWFPQPVFEFFSALHLTGF
eukprot:TRINITY_DN15094_c0_g1_i4.p1 TRINITY_DN15094_c0_g1~~TRINITY_DN15094_c0_g1_i4.p1  ORF type:complete len:130 (-),score=24.96 TRINITY_DN15094_c0_g1_i4:46-435(-)